MTGLNHSGNKHNLLGYTFSLVAVKFQEALEKGLLRQEQTSPRLSSMLHTENGLG